LKARAAEGLCGATLGISTVPGLGVSGPGVPRKSVSKRVRSFVRSECAVGGVLQKAAEGLAVDNGMASGVAIAPIIGVDTRRIGEDDSSGALKVGCSIPLGP
jgi:shikimate kinase